MPKSFRREEEEEVQSKDSLTTTTGRQSVSRALPDEAQLRHGFPLGHGSAQGGSSRFSSDFFLQGKGTSGPG